jgi:3-methyladenine DNA glycosylase AlkD
MTDLVTAVRSGLADLADPAKATGMQKYMKSSMPFLGVASPERRALGRALFAAHPLSDVERWRAAVLTLWREARYREERYLAVDLTGFRLYSGWQTPDELPLYEELIVTGAWWDYVDELAGNRVGALLRAHPARLTPVMRGWATDVDLWKRRTSIICQLGSKEATDTALLTFCVEANMADRDFFIRKAIGWALRQYARTAPDWVRDFVDTHPELSPLSTKEATKHL